MSVSIQSEHAIRYLVKDDRISVIRGRHPASHLERFQIEDHYGLIVSGCSEASTTLVNDRGAMRTVDSCNFTNELSTIFIHNHKPIVARDIDAML